MTRQLVVYAAKGEVISPTLLRVTAGRSTTRESREIKKGYRAGENRTKPAEKARKQAILIKIASSNLKTIKF